MTLHLKFKFLRAGDFLSVNFQLFSEIMISATGVENRGPMDVVHEREYVGPVYILMDSVHGPDPRRGSMDKGSMF